MNISKYVFNLFKIIIYIVILLFALHYSIRYQIYLSSEFPKSIFIRLVNPMLPLCVLGFLVGFYPAFFPLFPKNKRTPTNKVLLSLSVITVSLSIIFILTGIYSNLYIFSIVIGCISYFLWGNLGYTFSKRIYIGK